MNPPVVAGRTDTQPRSTRMVLRATLAKAEEKRRVRAALLRAALHLAAKYGFASLGLREVAREAGIAPTSFYRHFADMEQLGSTLIHELTGGFHRELEARVLAAPPADAIGVLIDTTFAIAARDPELVRFIIAERAGPYPALRELLRGQLAGLAQAILAAVRGEEHVPGRPPLAAEAAVSVLLDVCARVLDAAQADTRPLREALSACLRALLAGAALRGSDA